MKRLITALAALCVLLLTSCKKESLSFGKYSAETRDGVLYLTLVNEKECKFQFEDGEETQGGYYISKGTIYLNGWDIYPLRMNNKIWWDFYDNTSFGKIHNESFRVNAFRVFYDENRRFDITFHPLN